MALWVRLGMVRPLPAKQEVMSPDLRRAVVTESKEVGMRGMVEIKLKLPALKSSFIPT